MAWETIISGAAAGAIVNVIWNILAKRHEYEYDYKKYILKKRQTAYEAVEVILKRLQYRHEDGTDNQCYHEIFIRPYDPNVSNERYENELMNTPLDPISHFNKDLNILTGNSMWLTDDIIVKINYLNNLINNCTMTLPDIFARDMFIKKGKEVYTKLETLRVEINAQYFEDMKNLKNINDFKRNKKFY